MKLAAIIGIFLMCGCYAEAQRRTLRVELPAELASRAKDVTVSPRIAELRRQIGPGVLALELKGAAGKVRLTLPGACPLVVDLRQLSSAAPTELSMRPLFDVGPSERVVGLGQSFELRAVPGCTEAQATRATFTVASGAPLEDVTITEQGRALRARTRATPPAKSSTWGVVPVSAREQSRLRSEISFQVEAAEGARFQRRLGVSAVARSSGLSEVGFAHPVLLSGAGLRLRDKPAESQAVLRPVGALFELRPDQVGRYRVSDALGHDWWLQSGRYDQMPLDCGRSGCHAAIAESALESPMTRVLESDLGGCHALTDPACASACHTTGEPGTADGGFTDVAAELGLPALPAEHDDLPRALRRLGGVGCMACHGPTKIPEPSERYRLMQNDVCAVCHDAPPRYGHVQALESSRMGHADTAPATRADPACARCHTAWGAVGRPAPPSQAEASGITCATCHDVHPHRGHAGAVAGTATTTTTTAPSHAGLLRDFALPPTLPAPPASFQGVSKVCISCHAPSSSTLRPEASAAAIVAGQGGLEPETGAPLTLTSPHATSARGCLSCHDSGPAELALGKSHGFRASEAACGRCHGSAPPRDGSLAERARDLLQRLDPRHSAGDVGRPWHANYQVLLPTPAATRALRDVLLVLEDPAADVHHPAYARALLDAAERLAPRAKP